MKRIASLILIILLLSGCGAAEPKAVETTAFVTEPAIVEAETVAAETEETTVSTETEPAEERFLLTFVGDCTFGASPSNYYAGVGFIKTVGEDYDHPFRNVMPYFENDEHEKAWFIRTALNRTNSFFTSAWKRRVVPLDEVIKSYDEMVDSEVLDAVMNLPKDISAAIHLYYYEDMSIKEISEVMKKSESAIKSLLFRGRKLLKISLEETNR